MTCWLRTQTASARAAWAFRSTVGRFRVEVSVWRPGRGRFSYRNVDFGSGVWVGVSIFGNATGNRGGGPTVRGEPTPWCARNLWVAKLVGFQLPLLASLQGSWFAPEGAKPDEGRVAKALTDRRVFARGKGGEVRASASSTARQSTQLAATLYWRTFLSPAPCEPPAPCVLQTGAAVASMAVEPCALNPSAACPAPKPSNERKAAGEGSQVPAHRIPHLCTSALWIAATAAATRQSFSPYLTSG